MKTCSKCATSKPYSEFYKDKSRKDGCARYCKECRKAADRKRYATDPTVKARLDKVRTDDPAKHRESRYAWRDKNPEKVKASYKKNQEWRNAYTRKWYKDHPEIRQKRDVKRRSKLKKAFVEYVDPMVVAARDKWVCQICFEKVNKKLKWPNNMSKSMDHVIPLARGGEHSYANVQLAHLSCNCRKGGRKPKPVKAEVVFNEK